MDAAHLKSSAQVKASKLVRRRHCHRGFFFLDAAAANTARAKRPSRMTSAMPPFDRYAAVIGVREHL
jgi:hypothetical protein